MHFDTGYPINPHQHRDHTTTTLRAYKPYFRRYSGAGRANTKRITRMDISAVGREYLFDKDFTGTSRRSYTHRLDAFIRFLEGQGVKDIAELNVTHVRRFLAYLREQKVIHTEKPLSAGTLHGYLRVVKAFMRWAARQRLGLTMEEANLITMPKLEQKVLEVFTAEQVEALLKACDAARLRWIAERDRAIIMLLLDTGIRATELCTLTLDQVHLSLEDSYLLVKGKGRKEREVGPIGKQCRLQLHRFIHRYRPQTSNQQVFLGRDLKALSPRGLHDVFLRQRDRAAITGVRCSAHTFRHTYAVNFLRGGGDVYKLSRLMGHEGIAVTTQYLKAFKSKDARSGRSVLDHLRGDV